MISILTLFQTCIILTSILPQCLSYVTGVLDVHKHLKILDDSLRSLTGKGLTDRMGIARSDEMYSDIHINNRYVVISHGVESDPIYNYGNAACLAAFARTWDELCRIPSADSVVRRSVDENLRTELMLRVKRDGFVDGVTGIRVTGDGRFLRLVDAVVWNCFDENNIYCGQAAFFDREIAVYLTDSSMD